MRSFYKLLLITFVAILLLRGAGGLFATTTLAGEPEMAAPGGSVYVPVTLHGSFTGIATPIPSPSPAVAPTATAVPASEYNREESAIISQINQEREDHGIPRLELVPTLTESARRHCNDMADNDFTGHTGSDGSTSGERMQEAGYEWSYRAEIIGWGFSTADRMMDWWLNSEQHREAILSPRYEDFGVCYVYRADSEWGHYWTVNFAAPADRSAQAKQPWYGCHHRSENPAGGSSVVIYRHGPCP